MRQPPRLPSPLAPGPFDVIHWLNTVIRDVEHYAAQPWNIFGAMKTRALALAIACSGSQQQVHKHVRRRGLMC